MGMGQAGVEVMVPRDDHVRCLQHLKHFIHLRQIVDSGDSEVVHETWPSYTYT